MWNKLCLCVAPLKFWFQTDLGGENSATCYMEGRQSLLTFLTVVARWSHSTSNFYALLGQNLTGEFMRKINASSWNLFTLTAEADRVLCQPVMFSAVFFHWMYKMKYSSYQESSVIHGWFVYWVLVEKCAACQSRKSNFGWHRFFFHLVSFVRGLHSQSRAILALLDSFQELHLELVSLSNYCIWCRASSLV